MTYPDPADFNKDRGGHEDVPDAVPPDMIAFESWCEAEGWMDAEDADLWRNGHGYEETMIDHMWIGWQGRGSLPTPGQQK